MNKILRTAVVICLLLMFTLFLAGCISIEMKVNDNGSCDLKYEIETQGMVGSDEVKKQLESGIDGINEEAGSDVAKLKSFKEKGGVITANISLKDISYMGDDSFFGKLSDFEKEFPGYLDNLQEAKKGESIARSDIKGAGKLNVLKVAGMTNDGELSEFKVILPGAVKYMSTNVSLVDSNTVNVNSGYGVIIYQRGGGGGGWFVYVLIIAIIIVVAVLVFKNKGKGRASTASTQGFTPAAAPAQAAAPAPTPVATPAATAPTAGHAAAPIATAPASSTDVIHCPHCNTELKSGTKFCSSCGGRVSE